MAAIFLKILKVDFLEKATFNFFLWIVDKMDYIFFKFGFWFFFRNPCCICRRACRLYFKTTFTCT